MAYLCWPLTIVLTSYTHRHALCNKELMHGLLIHVQTSMVYKVSQCQQISKMAISQGIYSETSLILHLYTTYASNDFIYSLLEVS